ncbi:amino acid ABC transporter substrate-binding protein [Flavobacterium undicola]|uniref:amino acid ABC transporter substrate-binding protein n=1 Tax=Flavobacterium undicola TaxID=1932779 RepID=UPI001376B760|nr:LysM peptidoglycan-binding domain-containing protein [Flavobacterium undicola]MBA0884699.1 LysM peptidoglycan-binding domain-containing protein [Flavobacterium undicola]
MKYFFAIWIPILMFTNIVISQGTITHKVQQGETINDIAKKYQVTPYDIYKLNPDAQTKLSPKSVLLIPTKAPVKTAVAQVATTHKVLPKETLFGIEKKYNVSDADLKKANPFLVTDGLQINQVLVIPSKNTAKSKVVLQEKALYHDVLAKETKFSIAKKYGITIAELEKKNPGIVPNLTVGSHLLIKGTPVKTPVLPQKVTVKQEVVAAPVKKYATYEVKPKETLYSLSKTFDMSQEELLALNPELKNGVEIGMLLKAPANTVFPNVQENKVYTDLVPRTNFAGRKKIALLLPFNVTKVEGDTVNSVVARLKKDKFLNMTLDFYAGALMAIDSAKTLGLPIDVQILDSEETKYASNIAGVVSANNLQSVDAIVGPFYQNNAEATARLLAVNNVPVISPLSKDAGNPIANLYQTIPSNDVLKSAMFNYMRSKKGNIVAVVDKKKESVIQYIKQNQADVKFVPLNEKGYFSAENLKGMLAAGRMNYVVMETGNTLMIKTTIAAMLSAMPNYQLQLVILEPNETLDTDEINFSNLVKLKLMYPSVIRDNTSPEGIIFENKFKKINSIAPSDYAVRGFDVTFDTMMRLMQNKSFEETVNATATEQFENKFEYYKKDNAGYTNKGVYIMYYDTDLTEKVAN